MSRPTLITGGAGFIGHALARRLAAAGHPVRILDLRPPPEPVPGVHALVGDVTDPDAVGRAMDGVGDVLHLAALAKVQDYLARPEQVLDTNILGTRHVLRAAADRDLPVLFASSSEAYGRNEVRLSPGADTVLGPTRARRWAYAVSKLAGEHYAFALRDRGLRVAVVRYFNVYGPGLDRPGEGRVVSRFLGRIRDGLPLELVDGGHAIRAFCYVDDAVQGTLAVRDALLAGSADGRVFNVGRDEPVTIAELARRMIALSGHRAGTVDVPGAVHFGPGFEEIPRRVPDLSALHALGFRARIPLDEGLRRTLAEVAPSC